MSFSKFDLVSPDGRRMDQMLVHSDVRIKGTDIIQPKSLSPHYRRIAGPRTGLWSRLAKLWVTPHIAPVPRCKPPPGIHFKGRNAWSERTDICSHLFHFCEYCQTKHLDALGITCFFNVDSGVMPTSICRIIERIVESIIISIRERTSTETRTGSVTVTLRRQGIMWLLSVSDSGIRIENGWHFQHVLGLVQNLATDLQAICKGRTTVDGSVIAILFAVPSFTSSDDNVIPPARTGHYNTMSESLNSAM